MKNLIITTAIVTASLFAAPSVRAENTTTCTTQYGGGVVCGTRTPETPHIPVKAGLGDISATTVGLAFVGFAGALYMYSRKNTSFSSLS